MNDPRRIVRENLGQKLDLPRRWNGVLGDGAGNVIVSGMANHVFVTINTQGVVAVFNSRVPAQYGLPVIVGYDPVDPGRLQVLSVQAAASEVIGVALAGSTGPAPASRYRWMDPAGGEDPLFVELRQFLPGRVTAGGGLYIRVYPSMVWTGTAWAQAGGDTLINLTSSVPATSGKALLVLVTINTSGAVVTTAGSAVDVADLGYDDIPAVPTSTRHVLGAVRLYNGQTVIREARTNTDIIDLRLTWSPATPVASIAVQEADGTPAVTGVTTIKVGNGDLTDEGSGVVRVKTAADSSGSAGSGWSYPQDLRLTLATGDAAPASDQTAKTTVYLTPYAGEEIALYDGAAWNKRTTGEISIKLTDTQNGNTTNGSAVVTALTDTSQLVPGMEVTGTGIPGSTTISTIDSGTQVTLSANATADGTGVALTFKVAAGKNVDIFAWDNAGTPKLEMAVWTDNTTRATALTRQNGVLVKNGATTRRYLGTVRTTSAGQTEDGKRRRFCWNFYNRQMTNLIQMEASYWTYNGYGGGLRQSNGNSDNQIEIVIGWQVHSVDITFACRINAGSGTYGLISIGKNSTSAGVNNLRAIAYGACSTPTAHHCEPAPLGYTYYAALEDSGSAITFEGDGYFVLAGISER